MVKKQSMPFTCMFEQELLQVMLLSGVTIEQQALWPCATVGCYAVVYRAAVCHSPLVHHEIPHRPGDHLGEVPVEQQNMWR
jgi:hypothetical protein